LKLRFEEDVNDVIIRGDLRERRAVSRLFPYMFPVLFGNCKPAHNN